MFFSNALQMFKHFFFQAYKVLGQSLQFLHQYKEALTSFLTALDLDPDHSDELTDLIADVAAQFCNIPEETRKALRGKSFVYFQVLNNNNAITGHYLFIEQNCS